MTLIDDSGADGENPEAKLGARTTCPGCGDVFVKARRNKRFCTRACAKRNAALMDPARDDPEFLKVRRKRKAQANARIRERLDRVAETFVTCSRPDPEAIAAIELLESALEQAYAGGDLRQALMNRNLIHDIGPRGDVRGVRAKRSRDHLMIFMKAIRGHCRTTRGMSLERYLARPKKRRLGARSKSG
jgi:hypothetical protein